MLNLLVHIHVASSDKERALEILRVMVERFGTELRCAGVQNLAFMYVFRVRVRVKIRLTLLYY